VYQKKHHLFGIDQAKDHIRETGEVIIAEGYLDVIAMHQSGIAGAVAPLGTALTDEQAALLSRFASRALVVFDGDQAGQKASEKAALTLARAGLSVDMLVLPAGTDPADIMLTEGPGALNDLTKSGRSALAVLVDRAKERFEVSTPEGKAAAAKTIYPHIQVLSSPVAREQSLRILASELGVRFLTLMDDFTLAEKEHHRGPGLQIPQPGKSQAEAVILSVAARFPSSWEMIREEVHPEGFLTPVGKNIAGVIQGHIAKGDPQSPAILSQIQKSGYQEILTPHILAAEHVQQVQGDLIQAFANLQTERDQLRLHAIKEEIATYENDPAYAQLSTLFAEKAALEKSIEGAPEPSLAYPDLSQNNGSQSVAQKDPPAYQVGISSQVISNQSVEELVSDLARRFLQQEEIGTSIQQMNHSSSAEFAEVFTQVYPHLQAQVHQISGERNLSDFPAPDPSIESLIRSGQAEHTFLEIDGSFYDAERPGGVDSPYQLPVFSRAVAEYEHHAQMDLIER
jgi:hypothetical protein